MSFGIYELIAFRFKERMNRKYPNKKYITSLKNWSEIKNMLLMGNF